LGGYCKTIEPEFLGIFLIKWAVAVAGMQL